MSLGFLGFMTEGMLTAVRFRPNEGMARVVAIQVSCGLLLNCCSGLGSASFECFWQVNSRLQLFIADHGMAPITQNHGLIQAASSACVALGFYAIFRNKARRAAIGFLQLGGGAMCLLSRWCGFITFNSSCRS